MIATLSTELDTKHQLDSVAVLDSLIATLESVIKTPKKEPVTAAIQAMIAEELKIQQKQDPVQTGQVTKVITTSVLKKIQQNLGGVKKYLGHRFERSCTSLVSIAVNALRNIHNSTSRNRGARAHKSTSKSSSQKSGSSDSDGSGEPPPHTSLATFKSILQFNTFALNIGILTSAAAKQLKRPLQNVLYHLAQTSSTNTPNYAVLNKKLDRILRLAEVMHITGLSRSHIYNLCTPGKYYDPTFPKKIKLSARAIGFLESEVVAWVLSRKEQTL